VRVHRIAFASHFSDIWQLHCTGLSQVWLLLDSLDAFGRCRCVGCLNRLRRVCMCASGIWVEWVGGLVMLRPRATARSARHEKARASLPPSSVFRVFLPLLPCKQCKCKCNGTLSGVWFREHQRFSDLNCLIWRPFIMYVWDSNSKLIKC
jgi:hypothetical protein